MFGTIVSGCFNVSIGGQKAARKSDVMSHGGIIVEGCPTVEIGASGLLAARVLDKFSCPASDQKPHIGGMILPPCCLNVAIGGMLAARMGDPTMCTSPGGMQGGGYGSGDADDSGSTECEKLWGQYDKEARDMIDSSDHDHRERNKVISGAYADLYLRNPEMRWAGLAAYASKTVGCAMDFSKSLMKPKGDILPSPKSATHDSAKYTYDMLGQGNRSLFLDVYPMHRFYEDHGWAKMQECASSRNPPVPAPALDAFEAMDKGKKTGNDDLLNQSVESLAYHEQVSVLQRDIYNDKGMQFLLDVNEANADGTHIPLVTYPAATVLGSECEAKPGEKTHKFTVGNRDEIYDVGQRMDWILNEVADDYASNVEGTQKHRDDLNEIRNQGNGAGAKYPSSPAGTP